MENMAEANARLVSANSWPFLSYGWAIITTNGAPRINMHVGNAGVGPAKIESAELFWKGVAYRTDQEFLKACCDADLPPDKFDSNLLSNEVLRAGDPIEFFGLAQPADPKAFDALKQAVRSSDFKLVVCYCSIFDECWKGDLTTLSLTPPRVKSCEQPKVPFDQGLLRRETS
jgi:hypothetical protein